MDTGCPQGPRAYESLDAIRSHQSSFLGIVTCMERTIYDRIGTAFLWPMAAGAAGAIISASIFEASHKDQSVVSVLDAHKLTSFEAGEWGSAEWLVASGSVFAVSMIISALMLFGLSRQIRTGN